MRAPLIGVILLTLAVCHSATWVSEQVSIQIQVTLQQDPPSISLEWTHTPVSDFSYADAYFYLFRCEDPFDPSATCWQTIYNVSIAMSTQTYSFKDTNIQIGKAYEYKVKMLPFSYGFIPSIEGVVVAGMQLPLVDSRGHVILMVEADVAANMTEDLNQLKMDMIGDGWDVTAIIVKASDTVKDIHKKIKDAHEGREMSTIFLFGDIAVPYSGDINPDAHPDHKGAWPADVFYTTLNESVWTDVYVNTQYAQDERNYNVPGDGKYDISFLNIIMPDEITTFVRPITLSHLEIGRVILNKFDTEDEMELLRHYLKKNHGYRHRDPEYTFAQKAVVTDGWKTNELLMPESNAATAWRTFPGLVGSENIIEGNLLEKLSSDTAALAYAVGYGTFTSEDYVGTTYDWLTKTVKSPIQFHYGSWFPDWDSPNNYLRSIIAGSHGLAVIYSARPHAYFHALNTGSHLGKSARLTLTHEEKYHTGYYGNIVSQALLGDPTLRMYIIDPPSNITQDLSETSGIKLSWQESTDTVVGYHVYRSSVSIEGPYTRVTQQIVSGNTFTDTSAANGRNYYMVRAIQLTQTPATTFYNPSQAAFFETTFVAPPQSTPPSSPTPETPNSQPSADPTPNSNAPNTVSPNSAPIPGTEQPNGNVAPNGDSNTVSSSSTIYVQLLYVFLGCTLVSM